MSYSYNRKSRADYLLMLLVFSLVAFGLIMIYSVSKYLSLQITDQQTDKYFLINQLVSLSVGIIAWIVFQAIDYRFWQKHTTLMLVITITLLSSVFIFHGGDGASGNRWVNLFGRGFQPSEIAKLTMIFYLSGWLSSQKFRSDINKSFMPFLLFAGGISLLMLIQKDLGTLGVLLVIAVAIYYSAGARVSNLLFAGGLGAFLLWLSVKIEPYRMKRVTAFFNPGDDSLNVSYHIRNALIAIGSGGFWGMGFGQSRQKYLYLPEAHSDSIFPIIAEELGFFRSSAVIFLYALIAYRGFLIARRAPDDFSRYVAVGITVWIVWQAFVNLAAMLGIVPLTGIPLPFISYGGTSLVSFLAGVGVLLNISKNLKEQK